MSALTKRSCARVLTVPIASALAAAPPGGIITRWSQNRSVAAFVRSVTSARRCCSSANLGSVIERTLSEGAGAGPAGPKTHVRR